jgi:hypothetical protein
VINGTYILERTDYCLWEGDFLASSPFTDQVFYDENCQNPWGPPEPVWDRIYISFEFDCETYGENPYLYVEVYQSTPPYDYHVLFQGIAEPGICIDRIISNLMNCELPTGSWGGGQATVSPSEYKL